MKTVFYLIAASLAFSATACKKEAAVTDTSKKDSVEAKPAIVDLHKELYGIYTGDFSGPERMFDNEVDEYYDGVNTKKLSLKINRITKDSVYGQSIVNGNQRSFRGIFNEAAHSFVLDEPGDDKTDGRFEVSLKGDSLNGKWSAFNKKAVKSPEKVLKLQKRAFVYNPNFMLDQEYDLIDWENPKDFAEKYTDEETGETYKYVKEKNRIASNAVFKLNASTHKLTENELKNLRKLDLEIIKNTVFARHGYSFKKATFRNFFESTKWYIPVSNNVDAELSATEKENVALLNRFIKYAEDKYDYFGR